MSKANSKLSAIAQQAKLLSDATEAERKMKDVEKDIQQAFQFIDDSEEDHISCYQLSQFFQQLNIQADEEYIYNMIMQHRNIPAQDRPALHTVQIDQEEFKTILTKNGFPQSQVQQFKQAFMQLIKVTPLFDPELTAIQIQNRNDEDTRKADYPFKKHPKNQQTLDQQKNYKISNTTLLQVNQLWNQMKFWDVMNEDEIEQVRIFFGFGGDRVRLQSHLDGLNTE